MIGQDTLGDQHPELARIINTRSLAGHAGADSAEAMRLLAGTTAWLERAVDPQHPALVACRHNLQALAVDNPIHPRAPRSPATAEASHDKLPEDEQAVGPPG